MTRTGLRGVVLALLLVAALPFLQGSVAAQDSAAALAARRVPATQFDEGDARRWLTYLSSDLLQGRRVFTEGYGLAASYIAGELRALGVEPLGDEGTYFQAIARRGYRVTHNSSISVTARGATRVFRHGDHVSFASTAGGQQTLRFSGAEFLGHALALVGSSPDVTVVRPRTGALTLVVGGTPRDLTSNGARIPRGLTSAAARAAALVQGTNGAAAAIVLSNAPIDTARSQPSGSPSASTAPPPPRDLVTTADMTRPARPVITADETFFDFLLGESAGGIGAIRKLADSGATLTPFALDDVQVTIEVDTRYDVVSTERTQNVVAVVRGTDPVLRNQYVWLGAHLDHVGYAAGPQPRGRTNVSVDRDGIWNGADDDGSGTTALLLIAKAMQGGPKPKRSVVFVWHAGEEEGLIGSQYMADNPVVPLADVEAVFNIDMIGRNRDNDEAQANTVFVIGADRISTDLHNVIVEANAGAAAPLTLDYEYNDVNDTNSFYTRSDHYSYAVKGVPVAFFFTGTHPDYHANTDTVDKILFPKLLRITDLVARAVWLVADAPDRLVRDARGPRSGRGFVGTLAE